MRRALVFQHMDHDHPGRFIDFLAGDGIALDFVRLFEGQVIPNLRNYDAMVVLGGAQNVWEEERFPWLREEKAAIREWVHDRAKPYIGCCLGHQLLASALGGEVAPASEPEVGLFEVEVHSEANSHAFFHGVPERIQVMQWHGAEVKRPPQQAVVLASSPVSQVQAMAIDTHALGTQYHCEFTLQSIASWSSLPTWMSNLENYNGPGAYQRFAEEALQAMPAIHAQTQRVYDNFATSSGLRKRS